MTALARYNANMEGEVEPEPIERLRFFLSLAITGKDWLDVEQFIDGVSNQLASRDAEIATLREQVKMLRDVLLSYDGLHSVDRWDEALMPSRAWDRRRKEALAATEPSKEIQE